MWYLTVVREIYRLLNKKPRRETQLLKYTSTVARVGYLINVPTSQRPRFRRGHFPH